MKGVPHCLLRWACHAGTEDFYPALAPLVSQEQNTCFLTANYFTLFIPIA